jgi:hypothetical protein
MRSFTYTQLPGRVMFGIGALDLLPREIELLGAYRALGRRAAEAIEIYRPLPMMPGN